MPSDKRYLLCLTVPDGHFYGIHAQPQPLHPTLLCGDRFKDIRDTLTLTMMEAVAAAHRLTDNDAKARIASILDTYMNRARFYVDRRSTELHGFNKAVKLMLASNGSTITAVVSTAVTPTLKEAIFGLKPPPKPNPTTVDAKPNTEQPDTTTRPPQNDVPLVSLDSSGSTAPAPVATTAVATAPSVSLDTLLPGRKPDTPPVPAATSLVDPSPLQPEKSGPSSENKGASTGPPLAPPGRHPKPDPDPRRAPFQMSPPAAPPTVPAPSEIPHQRSEVAESRSKVAAQTPQQPTGSDQYLARESSQPDTSYVTDMTPPNPSFVQAFNNFDTKIVGAISDISQELSQQLRHFQEQSDLQTASLSSRISVLEDTCRDISAITRNLSDMNSPSEDPNRPFAIRGRVQPPRYNPNPTLHNSNSDQHPRVPQHSHIRGKPSQPAPPLPPQPPSHLGDQPPDAPFASSQSTNSTPPMPPSPNGPPGSPPDPTPPPHVGPDLDPNDRLTSLHWGWIDTQRSTRIVYYQDGVTRVRPWYCHRFETNSTINYAHDFVCFIVDMEEYRLAMGNSPRLGETNYTHKDFHQGFPKLVPNASPSQMFRFYDRVVQYCLLYRVPIPILQDVSRLHPFGDGAEHLPAHCREFRDAYSTELARALQGKQANLSQTPALKHIMHFASGYQILLEFLAVAGHPRLAYHSVSPTEPKQTKDMSFQEYLVAWEHFLRIHSIEGRFFSDRWVIEHIATNLHSMFVHNLTNVLIMHSRTCPINTPLPSSFSHDQLLSYICSQAPLYRLNITGSTTPESLRSARTTSTVVPSSTPRTRSSTMRALDVRQIDDASIDDDALLTIAALMQNNPRTCDYCSSADHLVATCPKVATLLKDPRKSKRLLSILEKALSNTGSDQRTAAVRAINDGDDTPPKSDDSSDSPDDSSDLAPNQDFA